MVAKAQTVEVSGLQSGVWSADTILVTGNVFVEDTLTIEAGTTVLFKGYYGISVNKGSIKALGTESDSIVFTVADTTGFHLFNFGRGSWNGIRLDRALEAQFDYCKFQFAKAATDDDQYGGALGIRHCDKVEIGHSRLHSNRSREHGGALFAEYATVNMHDCAVTHNAVHTELDSMYYMYGGALRFKNCDLTLTDTDFHYNDGAKCIGGALCMDSTAVRMERCVFDHNHGMNGGAFYLFDCNDKQCTIANCLITDNVSEHFAGGFALRNASPEISNVTVVNNRSIGVNVGGIFFYQESSPNLYNCIVWGNHSHEEMPPVQMWLWVYEPGAPSFYNCLSQGGLDLITGPEFININENMMTGDPLFADAENGDFRLSPESPCINAGSPRTSQEVLEGLDLDHSWRVCGAAIDLGAYEYTAAGFHENAEVSSPLVVIGNPLNDNSFIEFSLPCESRVSAKVYSLNGTLVWSKDFGMLSAGNQRLEMGELAGKLPHGVYGVEVATREGRFFGKVVK